MNEIVLIPLKNTKEQRDILYVARRQFHWLVLCEAEIVSSASYIFFGGCSTGVLVDRFDPILVPIDVCMWWQDYVWVTESVPRPFVTSRLNREPTAFEERVGDGIQGWLLGSLPSNLPPRTPLYPSRR